MKVKKKKLVAKGWLSWMLTVKNGGQTSNSKAKAEHMGCRWTGQRGPETVKQGGETHHNCI